jgi:hypothetical protein
MSRELSVIAVAVAVVSHAASPAPSLATTAGELGGCGGTVPERVLSANPSTYGSVVSSLQPGDLLQLDAGTYTGGLWLWDLHGEEDRCIIIEGPETGPAAVFVGSSSFNTVSIRDASYLVVRDLELDGSGTWGDGVKAESTGIEAHHITLENLSIHDHDLDQQVVGISTKCPAWNWVIRRNIIDRAGTGMYLGNSDGSAEFVNGLVEHNLVVDTVGYNVQVKHQNARTRPAMPVPAQTLIRHNVFSKADNGSSGGAARPNLLVGHWPLSGDGADDNYLIYGNFFYMNPNEALFQGEGNIIFFANLLVNHAGPAVHVQPHNDVPRRIRIVQNTVVATGMGIRVGGGDPGHSQQVTGNASFAGTPLSGGTQTDNVTGTHAAASSFLVNPDGVISGGTDRLDLYPLSNMLSGPPMDLSGVDGYEDIELDFNGSRRPGTFRGGYAGDGSNPGWLLALERKPDTGIFADGFESGDTTAW